MRKPILSMFVLLAGIAAASPALAQQNDRQLIIFGNDKCPAGTVCVRAPESDRFRIPQTLRSGALAPANQPWAQRASSVARAGSGSPTGSCSAAGAGGQAGCWSQQMKAWRDDRKQQAAAAAGSAAPQ